MRDFTPPIKKTRYIKPEMNPEPPPEGTQFRCNGCNRELFGVFDGVGRLVIRYGNRVTTITGIVNCECRKCGVVNSIDTRKVSYKIDVTYGTMLAEPLATQAAIQYAEKHNIDLREIPANGKVTISEVRQFHERESGS